MRDRPSHGGLTLDRIYDEPDPSGIALSLITWRPDGRAVTYLREEADRDEILDLRRWRACAPLAVLVRAIGGSPDSGGEPTGTPSGKPP